MPDGLDPAAYLSLIAQALREDVGPGDVTTQALVPVDYPGRGVLVAKQRLVLAGLDVLAAVFRAVDPDLRIALTRRDGDLCAPGDELGVITGRAASLLVAERTALNILQHLSGIATLARAYVEAAGDRLVILDTRKTVPGLRALAKYAVRCGGASNHRTGLFDAVLIKDNHIRIAGGVTAAIARVRSSGHGGPIEVEAQSLAQVEEACAAQAETIMLDNLDDATTAEAIRRMGGRARVELSGNMTLERVRRLATSGADCVSIGALTHSAPAADISFEISA